MSSAIDAEARAVIEHFVAGRIDHHWLFDWYLAQPKERRFGEAFDPFVIFMDIDDGLTSLNQERERLSALINEDGAG